MKRFLLFSNFSYYPHGGMWDYRGDFHTIEEAEKNGLINPETDIFGAQDFDWYQVVDSKTMEVVRAKGSSCYGDPSDFKLKK